MDELDKALRAAAAELGKKYDWQIGGAGPLHEFLEVVGRHVAPLVDIAAWRKRKIAALQAEIIEHEQALAALNLEGG